MLHNITFETYELHLDLQSDWKSISNYTTGQLALKPSALADLMIKMPFEQMRFHCFKKSVGRRFHIVTNRNASGNGVIRFLTAKTDDFPNSCGSYVSLIDDNSELSSGCAQWKWKKALWGGNTTGVNQRLINHVAFISGRHHWNTIQGRWECDDYTSNNTTHSPGDYWHIFVR